MSNRSIALVTPSIEAGGAERVMTQLANYFVQTGLRVYLILLVRKKHFYTLDESVKIIEPTYDYKQLSRLKFTFRIFKYLRKHLKDLNPEAVLSFGGRYNSFVLLASFGLNLPVFISDRSRPSISYGRFLDQLNKIVYKKARGIIAQTILAKKVIFKKTNHPNIKVIGNPIRDISEKPMERQNIILNVGRFIASKQQSLLVDFFYQINPEDWQLIFLGDGPELKKVKDQVEGLQIRDKVVFPGNVRNVDDYYRQARIFAFTSNSEGFPNALGEAMKAGLACVSFNCEAGPDDLIDDGENGILVKLGDHQVYIDQLSELISVTDKRRKLGNAAIKKMENFQLEHIGKRYINFLFENK